MPVRFVIVGRHAPRDLIPAGTQGVEVTGPRIPQMLIRIGPLFVAEAGHHQLREPLRRPELVPRPGDEQHRALDAFDVNRGGGHQVMLAEE